MSQIRSSVEISEKEMEQEMEDGEDSNHDGRWRRPPLEYYDRKCGVWGMIVLFHDVLLWVVCCCFVVLGCGRRGEGSGVGGDRVGKDDVFDFESSRQDDQGAVG